MSAIIEGLKYAESHEWLKDNGDDSITCGISDHAQHQLTDIVFVELPEIGKVFKKGEQIAVVESVKAVSDIYSPVSGEVIEVNSQLEDNPEMLNKEPYTNGWILKLKISNPEEIAFLMESFKYKEFIGE